MVRRLAFLGRVGRLLGLPGEGREAQRVDTVRLDAEYVARRVRVDRVVAQVLAEPGHVGLHGLLGPLRQILAPEAIHEYCGRYRPIGREREDTHQRGQAASGQTHHDTITQRLERPEQPDLQHLPSPVPSASAMTLRAGPVTPPHEARPLVSIYVHRLAAPGDEVTG